MHEARQVVHELNVAPEGASIKASPSHVNKSHALPHGHCTQLHLGLPLSYKVPVMMPSVVSYLSPFLHATAELD